VGSSGDSDASGTPAAWPTGTVDGCGGLGGDGGGLGRNGGGCGGLAGEGADCGRLQAEECGSGLGTGGNSDAGGPDGAGPDGDISRASAGAAEEASA